jgi:hypothetical protein
MENSNQWRSYLSTMSLTITVVNTLRKDIFCFFKNEIQNVGRLGHSAVSLNLGEDFCSI